MVTVSEFLLVLTVGWKERKLRRGGTDRIMKRQNETFLGCEK